VRIVVSEREVGMRVDQLVAERLSVSRAEARRLIAANLVQKPNGRAPDKGHMVALGQEFTVLYAAEQGVAAQPDATLTLRIAHQDAQLVLVDKPVGMPSHPLRAGELGCVANGLLAQFPEMLHVGYDTRQAGLVNRLDNDTSGLLLAARDVETFAQLRELLRSGGVHKRYLALTEVAVEPGELSFALAPRGKRVAVVSADEPEARPAQTRVISCEPHGRYFLVELSAERAYRHQVRAHLAHIGAPLVGDVLYGGSSARHHFLHASRMSFVHPQTQARLDLESQLPDSWPR
jgi:23S rRNA pseudouridine1911/1915/1917 synthase